jgi:hypothetical protein
MGDDETLAAFEMWLRESPGRVTLITFAGREWRDENLAALEAWMRESPDRGVLVTCAQRTWRGMIMGAHPRQQVVGRSLKKVLSRAGALVRGK